MKGGLKLKQDVQEIKMMETSKLKFKLRAHNWNPLVVKIFLWIAIMGEPVKMQMGSLCHILTPEHIDLIWPHLAWLVSFCPVMPHCGVFNSVGQVQNGGASQYS